MTPEHATELIAASLGSRQLIWIGYHGIDAEPLLLLPQFSHCYSFGTPLGDERIHDFSVERRLGVRRLNQTSWGNTLAFTAIGETLMPACEAPSVITAFLPLPFFERIEDERPATHYLGLPWEQFQLLNSKLYAEEQLRRFAGSSLQFVDWRPLPRDASRANFIRAEVRTRPVVLRSSFGQSGLGHELIRDEDDLRASHLIEDDALSIGPYLEDQISLAVGACLFDDGEVTLHCPSVQLVGLPHRSDSPFAYCGNDFAAIKQLDRRVIEDLEAFVRTVAQWLHAQGYVGVFGVDAMLHHGRLLYSELNPRFQGSTWLVNRMEAALGLADMVQDHLLAWLGAGSHRSPPLVELVAAQPPRSQVLVFNRHEERVRVKIEEFALPDGVGVEMLPSDEVLVDPADLMLTLSFDRGVTTNGHSLDTEGAALVGDAMRAVELRGARLRQRRQSVSGQHDRTVG
jgi:hypothetical protein